jgi:hypothetical protein
MFAAFLLVLGSPPPTRRIPLLSKQPAFCAKQFGTNYVWLAQSQLACLGMDAPSCGGGGGGGCGVISINGVSLNVTNYNSDDHDVCGTCQGCATTFIGLATAIPAAAQAFEGKGVDIIYYPPPTATAAAEAAAAALPDCPALPPPWRALQDKQITPACSSSESKGSLGVCQTAGECLAKAKANGGVNFAVWRGDADKSCDACALRWRGPAENWEYSGASGATSFADYIALPLPKPSDPCEPCPPNPPPRTQNSVATTLALDNGRIRASFGARGLDTLSWLSPPSLNVSVGNDAFAIGLDGAGCVCSSKLATPTTRQQQHGDSGDGEGQSVSFTFASPSQELSAEVTYELRPGAAFVSKTIVLTDTTGGAEGGSGMAVVRTLDAVSAMDGVILTSGGEAPGDARTASNVKFQRWADGDDNRTTSGAFLTAQNQFVDPSSSLSWVMDQNWTASAGPKTLDSAIIGLYCQESTSQLELAEAAAMTRAVEHFLVAPSTSDRTVKINIAWCENDYQLDIALEEDRETYKRIIDRAAEMGLTHILFAPRNSDVSSRENNTDPWGWEQILWFGMGQKLRMGEWKPGDPLAASTQELLDYFKHKGVKPVAYIYPILAFLAGTLPGGGSPPWIVHGTYSSGSDVDVGAGILRSNLANEEFIQWLPETMLAFANATGAGGFSFDLTYWEENLPVASGYAQWAGWRQILQALHRDGGCGSGSRCVVDNRQANHGWGAWMWAQGGTYAEPLMSDEQPGSWSFYEADLHTDRLAGNKQRQVAELYRSQFCPNDALPGFAFHQTDRDATEAQKGVCADGRCSNHSRVRDFDLLGYRYSLLSSIGTGGLNNVVNMLPARDEQEFKLFPTDDLSFVNHWLAWTDANVGLLQRTRPVPSLATPGVGDPDGTIMLGDDKTGYMFLYNPTMREINVSLPLSGDSSASLGFQCSGNDLVLVKQVTSSERSSPSAQAYDVDLVKCAEGNLALTLPPTTARVFEFAPWDNSAPTPVALGAPAVSVEVDSNGAVTVVGAQGESGLLMNMTIVLPAGQSTVKSVMVNGKSVGFTATTRGGGVPAVTVGGASWAGKRFARAQEIRSSDSAPGWSGAFTVPQSAMDQLEARNASYPVQYNTDPKDTNDADVPWLAPGRILLFVKYAAGSIDDTLNVTGSVDEEPLLFRKAYNTIVRNAGRFIGHWADVTPLVKPGQRQTLKLQLPAGSSSSMLEGTLDGVFFDNVETIFTSEIAM